MYIHTLVELHTDVVYKLTHTHTHTNTSHSHTHAYACTYINLYILIGIVRDN